jgi:hypothetical protein
MLTPISRPEFDRGYTITERKQEQRRMPPSGMLRHVALVRTNVSEEYIASIIRVTRIGELGTLVVSSKLTHASFFT